MENRDNQQESLLWWLGGIIDGEGCITIIHHRLHLNTTREGLLFQPVIIITNTDKLLIETSQNILRNSDIPFYTSYYERKEKRKEKWLIRILGLKRVSKALTILTPYIISKKEIAKSVKRFCDLRLTRPLEVTSYGGKTKPMYSDEEFDVISRVAEMHNRNPQRLHAEIRNYKEKERPKIIRNRLNGQYEVAKQDIVRTNGRPLEAYGKSMR